MLLGKRVEERQNKTRAERSACWQFDLVEALTRLTATTEQAGTGDNGKILDLRLRCCFIDLNGGGKFKSRESWAGPNSLCHGGGNVRADEPARCACGK